MDDGAREPLPSDTPPEGWICVLYTARWCDPGVPMAVIFEEVVRDLHTSRESFSGICVDVDDEEDDHVHSRPGTRVSQSALDSIDFVPMIVLYRGSPDAGSEVTRLVGQFPKLSVRKALLEAIETSER